MIEQNTHDDYGPVISAQMLHRGDPGHADAARTLTGVSDPDLTVRPQSADDVAAAVRLASARDLPVTVRAGGHSMAGLSTAGGGLLVDLRGLDHITVDPTTRVVRIGGGANWGAVAHALQPHGLGLTAGDTSGVGVGGLTLGGGIGWMARRHGLAIDHLVGAEVVTATGEIIEVSAEQHPDLFWALRGGAGGLGVVTRFDFLAQQVHDVVFGSITIELTDPVALLTAWRDIQRGADERLTTVLSLVPPMAGQPAAGTLQLCFAGEEAEAKAPIERLSTMAGVIASDISVRPYAEVLADAHMPPGIRVAATNTFLDLSDAALGAIGHLFSTGGTVVSVRALGGAVARVPAEETAFAHRSAEAMVVALRFLTDEADEDQTIPGWDGVADHGGGAYVNFLSSVEGASAVAAYPDRTRDRLVHVAATYDPTHLFRRRAATQLPDAAARPIVEPAG